jgi:hypothetical protein
MVVSDNVRGLKACGAWMFFVGTPPGANSPLQ